MVGDAALSGSPSALSCGPFTECGFGEGRPTLEPHSAGTPNFRSSAGAPPATKDRPLGIPRQYGTARRPEGSTTHAHARGWRTAGRHCAAVPNPTTTQPASRPSRPDPNAALPGAPGQDNATGGPSAGRRETMPGRPQQPSHRPRPRRSQEHGQRPPGHRLTAHRTRPQELREGGSHDPSRRHPRLRRRASSGSDGDRPRSAGGPPQGAVGGRASSGSEGDGPRRSAGGPPQGATNPGHAGFAGDPLPPRERQETGTAART